MSTLLKNLFQDEENNNINGALMENEKSSRETTLCIINDSVVMREGIKSILSNIYHVDNIITTSKDDYFDKFATKSIDIIITDIEFGKEVDPDFIKQIKAISPSTHVIVYTRIKNHTQRTPSLDCGAQFFIFWEDRFQLLEHVVERMIRKVVNQES